MSKNSLFESEFEQSLATRLLAADAVIEVESDIPDIAVISVPLNGSLNEKTDVASRDDPPFDAAETRRHIVHTDRGKFWIVGNSILCECPDCGAPMTIRSWLQLADCWRCQASTRLTREQIDTIEEIGRQQTTAPQPVNRADTRQPTTAPANSTAEPIAIPVFDDPAGDHDELHELNALTQQSVAANFLRRGFSAIPAWLLSFLLHLLLILLLALFVFSTSTKPPTITLSTFVSPDHLEGGEVRIENPEHLLTDDLAMANDLEVEPEELRDVLQKARTDAEELTVNEAPLSPLPDIDDVKRNVTTSRDRLMSFAARDPRVRAEIVQKEGGTSFTEAAVARGLRWLAQVQNRDGSWSLADYDKSHRLSNKGDAAGTSLALLPFLGAGQTHEVGIYKETVAKGLAWLIKHQKEDGDLRINFGGQAGIYAHGQATIVLCEALAMSGDQRFKEPAQKAIQFIENAQHEAGGWRYRPKQTGDTSVLGWQLMALQSARAGNLGIEVDDSTFKLADYFLDQAIYRKHHRTGSLRNLPTGSLYTYKPGTGTATAAMTAEAILCRMYLGWTRDDPRVIEAVRWLIEFNLPSSRKKNVYYWYYATQVMHHFGGEVWDVWNRRMREILVASQEKSGSRAGSWNPQRHKWGSQGGRIYVTSLSVCTLEVYYRHLPLFKQIELDDRSTVSAARTTR